jgi:hypothetical protein
MIRSFFLGGFGGFGGAQTLFAATVRFCRFAIPFTD